MRTVILTTLLIVIAIGYTTLTARPSAEQKKTEPISTSQAIDNQTWIDANKILMFVTNHGNMGRDLTDMFNSDAGTFYPFQDTSQLISGALNTYVIYASGLWLAGKVNDEVRVAIAEYSDEYVPGPMLNGTFQPDQPEFKVYKLYADSLESSPNADYTNWPIDHGAPVDADGKPAMRGDQMLWTVFNDADPAAHTNNTGETAPLGIEIKQTVWAVDDTGSIEIPIPLEILITHVGSSTGRVQIEIFDEELLNGHEFQVTFEADPIYGSVWDLTDLTTSTLILNDMTEMTKVVDGAFIITIHAPTYGVKPGNMLSTTDSSQWGWDIPNGTRRFSPAGGAEGYSFEGFYGALGWASPGNLFGVYDPVPGTDLVDVLLKLAPVDSAGNFDPNHPDVSYAYRYLRAPGEPARPEFGPYITNATPPGGSYGFQDFNKSCPLSAWNVSVDPPQRLTVGYLENNSTNGLVDGKYWPGLYYDYDNTASTGPREWLWIYLDDYSEAVNPDFALNAIDDPMPIMYWATWARRIDGPWLDEDEFLIIPNSSEYMPPTDTFTFTPIAPELLTSGPEGMTIYIQYELANKGGENITDMYVGLWSDPDLGGAGDDLVGCDPENNLFFCYNATDTDSDFFNLSPAVGYKLEHGPIVPSVGDTAWYDGVLLPDYRNLPLTSVNTYFGALDPDHPNEVYNNMLGTYGNGDLYIYNGDTTTFMHAGDPVTGTGDLDYSPADRRMIGSVGPFNMAPGDKQGLLFKLIIGQGLDRLSSITNLRENANSSTYLGDNANCCGYYTSGQTGNVDFDNKGKRNLADIVKLIDNIYLTKRPLICKPNSNITGDLEEKINLTDITALIDHIFLTKAETSTCQ